MISSAGKRGNLLHVHVLVIASSCIFIVGGNVHLSTFRNWDVCITDSITSTDLGPFLVVKSTPQHLNRNIASFAYRVERNCQRPSGHLTLGLSRMVNDGLVILIRSVREIHADYIQSSFAQHINLLY